MPQFCRSPVVLASILSTASPLPRDFLWVQRRRGPISTGELIPRFDTSSPSSGGSSKTQMPCPYPLMDQTAYVSSTSPTSWSASRHHQGTTSDDRREPPADPPPCTTDSTALHIQPALASLHLRRDRSSGQTFDQDTSCSTEARPHLYLSRVRSMRPPSMAKCSDDR